MQGKEALPSKTRAENSSSLFRSLAVRQTRLNFQKISTSYFCTQTLPKYISPKIAWAITMMHVKLCKYVIGHDQLQIHDLSRHFSSIKY